MHIHATAVHIDGVNLGFIGYYCIAVSKNGGSYVAAGTFSSCYRINKDNRELCVIKEVNEGERSMSSSILQA